MTVFISSSVILSVCVHCRKKEFSLRRDGDSIHFKIWDTFTAAAATWPLKETLDNKEWQLATGNIIFGVVTIISSKCAPLLLISRFFIVKSKISRFNDTHIDTRGRASCKCACVCAYLFLFSFLLHSSTILGVPSCRTHINCLHT